MDLVDAQAAVADFGLGREMPTLVDKFLSAADIQVVRAGTQRRHDPAGCPHGEVRGISGGYTTCRCPLAERME